MKNISLMPSYNDLQAGDVLLFRASKKNQTAAQRLIMVLQPLIQAQHGHFDTVHAAICVGHNANGEALIAEVDGSGLHVESYPTMIKRESKVFKSTENKAFLIFRPKDKALANSVANLNNEQRLGSHKMKYDVTRCLRSAFTRSLLPITYRDDDKHYEQNQRKIASSSICTSFVVQVVKRAAANINKGLLSRFANIRSAITPKKLESYLYQNPDYDLLVYPGCENPYQEMMVVYQRQIKRLLANKEGSKAKQKGLDLQAKVQQVESEIANTPNMSELGKVRLLLSNTKDILQRKTGFSFRASKSSREVYGAAREMGLFKRDLSVQHRTTKAKNQAELKLSQLGFLANAC